MSKKEIPLKSKRFLIVGGLLLAVSATLHLYRLDSIPNGFFGDECAIGYNAWSILKTGCDEYGTAFPVFLRCFDNYHEPVMVYTIAPLMKIWGMSKWCVRFPEALYLLLASVAFYFLAQKLTRNRYASLAASFIFSLSPWVFPVSRSTMSGYTPMLLGIILGCLFLRKMIYERSLTAAVAAALSWAFAMYAHNCGRPATAAVLVCFAVAFNKSLIKRIRELVVFSGVLALSVIPIIVFYLNNQYAMTARFNQISVWKDSPSILEAVGRVAARYFEYFSPTFLFVIGDVNPRHNTGVGELFVFTLPFLALGVTRLLRRLKRDPYSQFLLLCVLTYPCAAMLTIDHYHSTRSLNGLPFWLILVAIGIHQSMKYAEIVCGRFEKRTTNADGMRNPIEKRIRPRFLFTRLGEKPPRNHSKTLLGRVPLLALMALTGLGCLEMVIYFSDYFSPDGYPERSRSAFGAPLVEAIEFVDAQLGKGDVLYISRNVYDLDTDCRFKPYKYATLLFCLKIPPAVYQSRGIPKQRVLLYDGGPIKHSGIIITEFALHSKSPYVGVDPFLLAAKRNMKIKLLKTITTNDCVDTTLKIYSLTR